MKDALLTILRSKDTDPAAFRKAAHTLSDLIAAEIAAEAEEAPKEVLTTHGKVEGSRLLKPPILIPILRAGMAPFFPHFSIFLIRQRLDLLESGGIKRPSRSSITRTFPKSQPMIRF